MSKIITMLLMTFILSCQTSYERKLTCSQIAKHQIPPVPLCDISFEYDRCRCRCFDYNSWSALPLKSCERFEDKTDLAKIVVNKITKERVEVIDFELEYCDGIGGSFNADQVTKVRPNVKALYRIKENLCP